MPKYLVALAVGGLMECPEITYQDYQEIEAACPEEARKIYNEKNKCDFFYGEVLHEIKEPETTPSDEFLNLYDEILTGESLAEEDLIAQAFSRLAIILGYTNCDKDNDICYHFDYLNKHFKVTIEVSEKD